MPSESFFLQESDPAATETVFRRMLETFPRILYKVRRRSNITEGQPADKCNLDGVCNISSAPSHQSAGSSTSKQHLVDAED
ncbi:hypothetical protein Q8A67_024542 [Cirrhinus molitorella]|uniref:Uncharacterized protein n=1 Tax=Cirrhinus molitorella TaxID=172907 RepID=A0AA88P250_9TELE|nr:hypothetical protein Q8A67_024542 [Cirrhinus molitorella]